MDATPTARDVFEAMVLRHQAALCAIAYAVLRDRARSEEVAQDALLIAWRDRAKVMVTPAWICGVARNLARNAARRRREVPMDREPATDDRDVRDVLIAREDAARANAALAKLADKYRDAIAIYYRSDESYADVAAVLDITEAAARQRVHRAREQLQERLSIVERTLRATRPGHAFTAAVVAAWMLGSSGSASAATGAGVATTASHAARLLPLIGTGVIVSTIGIAVALRVASADHEPTRDTTAHKRHSVRRFPLMTRTTGSPVPTLPTLPPGFTPANAPTNAPSPMTAKLDIDFKQVWFNDLMQLVAHESQTPIFSTIDPIQLDISAKHIPVIDVLDRLLTQAHATRTEVEALKIVEHGASDAATLGGDTMSLSVRALPLNRVLDMIEPKLAIPIARVGRPFRAIEKNGNVVEDQSPPVTLDLTDVTAGLALQRALEQTGYGYELTTGFVITPD